MIQKDIDALEREKSNTIKKNNFIEILENIGAIFTGAYLYYGEVPKKTIVERNISEGVKLRRRRLLKLKKKKKTNYKLFNEYFINYRSPSDMYKTLRATEGERNEDQVYVIKKMLNKMQQKSLKRCLRIEKLWLKKTKR